jgi:glucose-6-phosphate 1-epimerase
MGVKLTDSDVTLTLPNDESTSVRILLYGATVLSWKVKGKEQLWLSEQAKLDGTKAVRGGIPLVFPVFGKSSDHETSKLPQHGFARISTWECLGQTEEDPVTVQLGLGPESLSDEARSQWSHDFTLLYTVSLSKSGALTTRLEVENTDKTPFEFNVLFHTYFRIPDVSKVSVSDLSGKRVVDKVLKSNYVEQTTQGVTIEGEVDRVYETESLDAIDIKSDGKPIFTITGRRNTEDVVVWNPWTDKANGLGDFYPKDGFKHMICVELGAVSKFHTISSGEKWAAEQVLNAKL